MNKWKLGFWISICLLLVVGAYSAYIIVDQSVTIIYMNEGYVDTEKDLITLTDLINETNLSKVEIENKLKSHRLNEFMDFKSDTVAIERVLLIFKNDKLEKIESQW